MPVLRSPNRIDPRIAAVLLCVAAMLVGARYGDDPAAGREDTAVASLAQIVEDDTLDPRIVALDLEGATWDARLADLEAALFAQRDAERRVATTSDALATARADLRATQHDLDGARADAEMADSRIDEHRAALQARALALFVGYGEEEQLDELDSIENATEGARHRQLASEVDDHQLDLLRRLEDERAGLGTTIAALEGRQMSLQASVAALVSGLATAHTDLQRADDAVPEAIEAARRARRSASIPDVDLPVVALDAYLHAEVALADSDPSCRLEWWMIAGVGRVESRHGTIGGRSLNADGRPNRAIIGIALDGGPGVRAIVDTDGGALDGDTEWDRAVGPMQFIPETWSIRGRDGNDDGVRDPQNLYDAAVAAGRYLCRLGGNLDQAANLQDAYFGYNTSSSYVALVERHALRYAELDLTAPIDGDAPAGDERQNPSPRDPNTG